jgi:hypothetical protein
VQVGTSRDSPVSRGADYPFTLPQLGEHRFSVIAPAPARVHHPRELDDLNQAVARPMSARCHQPAHGRETLEVTLFS